MPDFTKIILRQGVENDREDVIYSSGEPLYITNFKRMFIGDGSTAGGVLVSNKFLGFAAFDINTGSTGVTYAYQGDTVFDKTHNDHILKMLASAMSSEEGKKKERKSLTSEKQDCRDGKRGRVEDV